MEKNFLTAQKKSAKDSPRTASERAIRITAEATGYSVRNKIAEKITKAVSKTNREITSKLHTQILTQTI